MLSPNKLYEDEANCEGVWEKFCMKQRMNALIHIFSGRVIDLFPMKLHIS